MRFPRAIQPRTAVRVYLGLLLRQSSEQLRMEWAWHRFRVVAAIGGWIVAIPPRSQVREMLSTATNNAYADYAENADCANGHDTQRNRHHPRKRVSGGIYCR